MTPEWDQNDLDWRAFRYVAGEMTAAETAAFEGELAENLGAAEAVARAVELTTTVATVERLATPAIARRSAASWSLRLSWLAAGIAATVAAVLVSQVEWSSPGQIEKSSAQLAEAWSASQDDHQWSADLAADEALPNDGDGVDENSVDLPAAPGWMLAAVRGLAERSMDDMDMEVNGLPPLRGDAVDN
jgi:hypothetical protein